ncbi:MAG: GNAT family N-acetyltransferase, partial [Vicinamibacteria bacterium]
MIEACTERLRLVAGTLEIAAAELEDRERFGQLLRAEVPPEWPPETLRDALPFFLELYQAHPDWAGWLGWYAISMTGGGPVLCGSVGFKGPPGDAGMVEIGYSILPAFQRMGLAMVLVIALIAWAAAQRGVASIEAETT